MKMRFIPAEMDKCPDHIVDEVNEIESKLADFLSEIQAKHAPNLILGALNLIYAKLLIYQISDAPGELEKAAILSAQVLIKNVEKFGKVKILDKDNESK